MTRQYSTESEWMRECAKRDAMTLKHTPEPMRIYADGCFLLNPAAWQEYQHLRSVVPDLVAALQGLLADKYLSDPINSDRMAAARAAVSKATGE